VQEFFAPILARFYLQPSLLAHLLLAAGARALSSSLLRALSSRARERETTGYEPFDRERERERDR